MVISSETIDHATARMSIDSSPPRFTETQGQYLAFIYYYDLVNRRPPAEAAGRHDHGAGFRGIRHPHGASQSPGSWGHPQGGVT
jgi:hypothetical protein